MTEPLLRITDLQKSFFGVKVLHGVSLTLDRGEVMGLVGENGSGKSTTMNLLGGVLRLESGEILIDGVPYNPRSPRDAQEAGIAFIHQELNLFENLSIEENMFIGGFPRLTGLPFIARAGMRRRAAAALARVRIGHDPATPLARLSQGERQLVEIARALLQDARIIIFDEPTTSLTHRETSRLFELIGELKASGIAIIYISHVLADIFRLCDTITVLRDGHVVGGGPASELTAEDLIRLMVGRSLSQIFPDRTPVEPGPAILDVERLSQPGIVRDITFQVRAGEVVGISGLMGAGRSELARILFGLDPFASGTIRFAGETIPAPEPRDMIRRGMAFLTEDRRGEGLMMEATIEENIALPSVDDFASAPFGRVDRARLRRAVRQIGDEVRISRTKDVGETPAQTLSGGNQQKVVLAKWLLRRPKLLVLDEPTRGIDVGAKFEVYKIIDQAAASGAGVLMISSELEELMGMCDRILVMAHGEIRQEFARASFNGERILEAAMWSPKTGEVAA